MTLCVGQNLANHHADGNTHLPRTYICEILVSIFSPPNEIQSRGAIKNSYGIGHFLPAQTLHRSNEKSSKFDQMLNEIIKLCS